MSNKTGQTAKSFAIVTGFVFEIVVIIALGFFLGRWLDTLLETRFLFTVLLMLGFMFLGIIRLIVRVNKMEDTDGK